MTSVAVHSLALGQGQPEALLAPVHLVLACERIPVRTLIRRAVLAQIEALQVQHRADTAVVQLALARQYLSARDIDIQAQEGRIRMAGAPKQPQPAPDIHPEQAVAQACHGFATQAFRVVVDGVMLNDLDEDIALCPDSSVVFLRLTPLAGG